MWFFRRIQTFFNSLSDAHQAVNTIVGVVVVAAGGWVVIDQFIKQLDISQQIAIGIVLLGLVVIFIIAFITWWRKHDVDNLPNYLSQLDEMLRGYVNNLDIGSLDAKDLSLCSIDLGELWHIDVNNLYRMLQQKDKIRIQKYSISASNQFSKMIDPKDRSNSTLKQLLASSGIMNYHGVGLDRIRETENYRVLFTKIKNLQRLVPSAETNIKVNEYWNWSDALYSVLLSYRLIMDKPEILDLLPAGEKASTKYIGRQIESSTATIISSVRESLDKARHRNIKES